MKNSDVLQAYKREQAEQAKDNLLDFTLYTKEDYEAGWFNELLCLELEKFLRDVEAGLFPRMMIFAPPRSGKSEMASRRFPAWVLGRMPHYNIIATSYSSDLSNRMSRDTQRIIDSPTYQDVFPDTRLNGKNVVTVAGGAIRTAELWETVGKDGKLHGGAYRAAGVNGGITGQGMNIGIIDDPAKDFATASSAAYQQAVMDWYDTTFMTRIDPKKNGVLIILTRWHELDLAGQLLDKMSNGKGEKFRVLSFPMEAEKDEIHELNGETYTLRKKGDILFPERMPRSFVEACKLRGTLTWNALYQQRPTSRGGSIIKTKWFKYYKVLPRMDYRLVHMDTAQKTGEENDDSALTCWGVRGNEYYLLDIDCGKWDGVDLEARALAFWAKHKEHNFRFPEPLRHALIEDKVSGTGLIQKIKRIGGIPVKAIQRGKGQAKPSRAMDVQGYIESGLVHLPDPSVKHQYWDGREQTDNQHLGKFLRQAESFTMDMSHAHDDLLEGLFDIPIYATESGDYLSKLKGAYG